MSDNVIHNIERDNLDAHVTVCAERYKRLEDKFNVLGDRLDSLVNDVSDMQRKQEKNMDELKELIQKSSDSRFRAVVAASATVVAALISALAFVITKIS